MSNSKKQKKDISKAKNPLLGLAIPALERAARRARRIALQTGTAIIIMENGVVRRITIDKVSESRSDYNTG